MELLERYLQAIGIFLPGKNKSDILRELRENILSQVEEKEAELHRQLDPREEQDLIRAHGHPIVVAARFSPQRYLIGPTLFPFYRITLLIALLIALLARGAIVLVTLLINGGNWPQAMGQFAGMPGTLLSLFGGITISFAILDYLVSAHKIATKWKWNPSSLPKLYRSRRTIPLAESAAGLIFGIAAAIWWQAVSSVPFLILGPAAMFIHPAPIWQVVHFPILVLIVLRATACGYDLLQPYVSAFRECVDMSFKAAEIIVLAVILHAGTLVNLVPQMEGAAGVVNLSIRFSLAVTLVIVVVQLAAKGYRIYRAQKTPAIDSLDPQNAENQFC